MRAAATILLSLALPAGLSSCGGASPSAERAADGDPLSRAEGDLADAQARLDRTLTGSRLARKSVEPEVSAGKDPAPAPPSQPDRPPGDKASATPLENAEQGGCEAACEALAAMRTAADKICSIAGPGERCDAARARVEDAEKRVTEACSECEA